MNLYRHNRPFELERGGLLPELVIAFTTYGELNAAHDNVVWVCHALTADSEVAAWWPHTVEAGRFLDPARHFIICANILGSHYGTTGPLHVNPATGRPYYGDFPELTIRDMVKAHRLLADMLGIRRIEALIGSSVGGFQAVEWAVEEPERIDKLVLIATAAKATPWSIAIDETQRMAIEADSTFGEPYATAGAKGLAAARAIGLLSYRGADGYNLTQQDTEEVPDRHRACTYQQHQGEKLRRRYKRLLLLQDPQRLRHTRRRTGSRRRRNSLAAHHGPMPRRGDLDRPHLSAVGDAHAQRLAAAQLLPPDRLPLRARRVSGRARAAEPNSEPLYQSQP